MAATSALGIPAARVDQPAGGLSQVPDSGASRVPGQPGAGWNATGDGPVPTSAAAAWTWETLPQSGTVQPNMQAQPPSAPAIMNADTATRAAPIFRQAVDAHGRSLIGDDGQIRNRLPVNFDPANPESFARTRNLMGALTWATGREWVLVDQGAGRIELVSGDPANVQLPSQLMFRAPDGQLTRAGGDVLANLWLSTRWDMAHSHPFGHSHLPSWGQDSSGHEWGDIATLRKIGADRGWIVAHPTANPHDPWVTVEFYPNGDWVVVPPESLGAPLRTPEASDAYATWLSAPPDSPINLANGPTAPLAAVQPTRAPTDIANQPTLRLTPVQPTRAQTNIADQPTAPQRALEPTGGPQPLSRPSQPRPRLRTTPRLVPIDTPQPPAGPTQPRPPLRGAPRLVPMDPPKPPNPPPVGWHAPDPRPGPDWNPSKRPAPSGYTSPVWVVDSQGDKYLKKYASTNLDTLNEVLARAIQGSVGVDGPPVYFGGPPSDPETPALVRDIVESMDVTTLHPDLTSILAGGGVVRQSLEGPDPSGVMRNVIFDYLTNNLFDNNHKNVLLVSSERSGLQIVSIDFGLGFGHDLAPPLDTAGSFLDLLRAPEVWNISPKENYAAHWLKLLGEALRGRPDGERELARQLEQVLEQYGKVDFGDVVARLQGDDLLPAGRSGGISEEQETYVRAWLQEFAARRQWLLEDREKILRAIWDGDLIL
jgi:hypothetical protein